MYVVHTYRNIYLNKHIAMILKQNRQHVNSLEKYYSIIIKIDFVRQSRMDFIVSSLTISCL